MERLRARIEEQIFAFIPKTELETGETDRGTNGGAGREDLRGRRWPEATPFAMEPENTTAFVISTVTSLYNVLDVDVANVSETLLLFSPVSCVCCCCLVKNTSNPLSSHLLF